MNKTMRLQRKSRYSKLRIKQRFENCRIKETQKIIVAFTNPI